MEDRKLGQTKVELMMRGKLSHKNGPEINFVGSKVSPSASRREFLFREN